MQNLWKFLLQKISPSASSNFKMKFFNLMLQVWQLWKKFWDMELC
jgi:hypothetical protein